MKNNPEGTKKREERREVGIQTNSSRPPSRSSRLCGFLLFAVCMSANSVRAQAPGVITATRGITPNLVGHFEQPLRYKPDGPDFVIENGAEYFNRPLYGRNTAFRMDAGDKPE